MCSVVCLTWCVNVHVHVRMFVGALKRPGWPRQIVLFHVPAGGSDLHVGVAAVRATYRCCGNPGATDGCVGLVWCTAATGLSLGKQWVAFYGLRRCIGGGKIPRKGRAVPSGVEDSRLEPEWFWRLGLVECSLFCSETVCVFLLFPI